MPLKRLPASPRAAASATPTALKEKSHMTWGWTWLESLAQDTLYGIRAMLRSPG